MKYFKIITLLFAFIILSLKANAHNWNSKPCEDSNLVGCWDCSSNGGQCTAKLNTNGELIVSGTGAVRGGYKRNATFSGLSVQPTSLKIEEGITSLKQNAFWGISSIQNVDLPNSLVEVGDDGLATEGNGISKMTLGDTDFRNTYADGKRITMASDVEIYCRGDIELCKAGKGGLFDIDGKHFSFYDANGRLMEKYDGRTLLEKYVYNSDGSVTTYGANGQIIGIQGKRIYTIDEATALVKNNKNTFTLKYR